MKLRSNEEADRFIQDCRSAGVTFRVEPDGSLYAGPLSKVSDDQRKTIRKNVVLITMRIREQMAQFEEAVQQAEDVYCPACSERFSMEMLKKARMERACCPKCGSRASPLRVEFDVEVRLNWHQVRLIGLFLSKIREEVPDPARSDIRELIRTLERSSPAFAKQHPISADALIDTLFKVHGLDQ